MRNQTREPDPSSEAGTHAVPAPGSGPDYWFSPWFVSPAGLRNMFVTDWDDFRLWNADSQPNCRRNMVSWIWLRSICVLRAEGREKVPGWYIRGRVNGRHTEVSSSLLDLCVPVDLDLILTDCAH